MQQFVLSNQFNKSGEALVHLKSAKSNGGDRHNKNHTYCSGEEGEIALSLTDNLIDSNHLDGGPHYHQEPHPLHGPRESAALDLL